MSVSPPSKSRRIVWLVLVLIVAFASPLITSVMYFLAGDQPGRYESLPSESLRLQYVYTIVFEMIALGLLVFALYRQKRGLRSIGFLFSWKDLPISVWLALLVYFVVFVSQILILYIYYIASGRNLNLAPQNIGFMRVGINSVSLLLTLVNPFYEELIVRAYLMTEVEFLTRSKSAAVIASVVLQTAYHLYQGWPSALTIGAMCLVFSLIYAWKKRITPIILTHLYFDLVALVAYA